VSAPGRLRGRRFQHWLGLLITGCGLALLINQAISQVLR
jgi:hypothetical protein